MKAEEQLQRAVINFLKVAVTDADCVYFHVPNGEYRSKATAGRLKAMGVRRGAPDLVFLLPGGQVGLIELKASRGRLTQHQVDFMEAACALGAEYVVARSVYDVVETLRGWNVGMTAT